MGIQINLRIQQCSDKFFEIGCRMPAQQLVDEELARDAVNNVPPGIVLSTRRIVAADVVSHTNC